MRSNETAYSSYSLYADTAAGGGHLYGCRSYLNGNASPTIFTTQLSVTDFYNFVFSSAVSATEIIKQSVQATETFVSGPILAYPLVVAYQSTDTQIISMMQRVAKNSTHSHQSLSKGGLIGAIVGPILFMILLGIGLVLCLAWKRQKREPKVEPQAGLSTHEEDKVESFEPHQPKYERNTFSGIFNHSLSEMGYQDPRELDASKTP
jgi:hypothetical protein